MKFTINDFDDLISSNKSAIKKVDVKFRNIIEKVSKKLGYRPYFLKSIGYPSAYIQNLIYQGAVTNFLLNSEDFSVELLIKKKSLILKFFKNIPLGELHKIKKWGDTELVIRDNYRKVIKLYPEYVDTNLIKSLIIKIKRLHNPALKIRIIYSRERKELKNIENEIIKSIKQIKTLFKYI